MQGIINVENVESVSIYVKLLAYSFSLFYFYLQYRTRAISVSRFFDVNGIESNKTRL